jgi:hypothetical protein
VEGIIIRKKSPGEEEKTRVCPFLARNRNVNGPFAAERMAMAAAPN